MMHVKLVSGPKVSDTSAIWTQLSICEAGIFPFDMPVPIKGKKAIIKHLLHAQHVQGTLWNHYIMEVFSWLRTEDQWK